MGIFKGNDARTGDAMNKNEFSKTICILLGFLQTRDWKDALKNSEIDHDEVYRLYRAMCKTYEIPMFPLEN